MSELKRRANGPAVKVRGDDRKNARCPTRSASIKTEMARIAYRDQQQSQQSVEGNAADQALSGAGETLHRAVAVPKAIRQQMVYQQESSKQTYPREKPVTVDYMEFPDEEPASTPLHHQITPVSAQQVRINPDSQDAAIHNAIQKRESPSGKLQALKQVQGNLLRTRTNPNPKSTSYIAEELSAAPRQRMKAEGVKSLRKQIRTQRQKRMNVQTDYSLGAQTESAGFKPIKPLTQLHHPVQGKSVPSANAAAPHEGTISVGTATVDNPVSQTAVPTESMDNVTPHDNSGKALKRTIRNRTSAHIAAEKSIEIHKAARSEIQTVNAISPRTALRNRKQAALIKESAASHFRRRSQQAMATKTVTVRQNIKKRTIAILKAAVQAMVKSVKSILGAIAGAGAGVLAPLIVIILIGALLCGPLGLFFTGEADNELTLQQAMMQINMEFSDKITEIETSVPHDEKRQSGHRAIWKDVLTIYAVKATTGSETPMDVATMDEAHLVVLRSIFWDMNAISYTTETYTETESVEVEVEGEDGEIQTETQIQTVEKTRLVIQIAGKDAADMAMEYGFTSEQIRMVRELLSDEYAEFWSMMAVPGVGSNDIVEVALAQVGNVGGKPYWSWYGFPYRVAWCACFVSWCADQCGYLDAGIIPRHSLVDDGIYWFRARGQWQDRYYLPSPGDIIYFDWEPDGSPDHVGIVESCDGFYVYTIEGNSGDACRQLYYAVGSNCIYGYGVPAY